MVEMGTEEQQQVMVGFSKNDATHIAKGKRTKRLRLLSPCGGVAAAAAAVITSSCSSASGGDNGSFSSTTITHESIDLEEEDMANCLILLAQGGGHKQRQGDEVRGGGGDGKKTEKGSITGNRRFAEITTTATNTNNNTKVGLYIYECKTCNRTFPSFQALGGHRASHKKPKLMAEEKKPSPPPPPPPPSSSQPQQVTNYDEFKESGEPRGPTISLQLVNHGQRAFHGNKAKIHECSICGSEFTSGQALGGHMRRHRTSPANTVTAVADDGGVRHRNILELDLNLPAPEDDIRESKFQFPATQKSMVLSAAPALVGCHY